MAKASSKSASKQKIQRLAHPVRCASSRLSARRRLTVRL